MHLYECDAYAFAMHKTLALTICSLRASVFMHDKMLNSLLKAPLNFFDITPTGRILNRFLQDVLSCAKVLIVLVLLGRVSHDRSVSYREFSITNPFFSSGKICNAVSTSGTSARLLQCIRAKHRQFRAADFDAASPEHHDHADAADPDLHLLPVGASALPGFGCMRCLVV